MQSIQVAFKRRKGEWRGALIVDNEFEDALIGPSVADLVVDAIGPALAAEYADGQEIAVNVTIRPIAKPEEKSGPQPPVR